MHQVATLATLRECSPKTVEVGGTKIMLVREGAHVHAFGATCPHAGAPLDEGAILDGRIVCPWHKACFRLDDGTLLEPPALDGLTRYPVSVEGDAVLVSATPAEAPCAPHAIDDPRVMLIVGTGAAGTAAACALREFGFSGRIVLLGQEAGASYDRTALSKFVLQGAMQPDEVPPLREAAFYAENDIECVQGEASRLDRTGRTLTLADGNAITYDRILIATGGTPMRLQVPGAGLQGVHTLRTREDAAAVLNALGGRKLPVVIAGASFIGLEAASALREQDIPVTVVSPHELPFQAQFGERIGAMFRQVHEAKGVRFLGGRTLARIEGDADVTGVVLDDGQRIEAALLLAGIGVAPATGFATDLEKTPDGGIIVDACMRAAGDVFAAGDVARFPLGGRGGVRVEHWRVAQQHARIAARSMLSGDDGRETGGAKAASLEQVPFFWTYHYGRRYEYLGQSQDFDRVEVDGDLNSGPFLARLTSKGELVGIVACDREAETAALIVQPHIFKKPG